MKLFRILFYFLLIGRSAKICLNRIIISMDISIRTCIYRDRYPFCIKISCTITIQLYGIIYSRLIFGDRYRNIIFLVRFTITCIIAGLPSTVGRPWYVSECSDAVNRYLPQTQNPGQVQNRIRPNDSAASKLEITFTRKKNCKTGFPYLFIFNTEGEPISSRLGWKTP